MARDYDALTAIATALRATNAFELVARYAAAEYTSAGDAGTFAFVAPATGQATSAASIAADGTGDDLYEAHEFELTVAVRDEDPERRVERLCRLRAVAEKAITGSSLGGKVLPAFSLLSRWRYAPARTPFKACVCTVQVAMLVAGSDAVDVTDVADYLA